MTPLSGGSTSEKSVYVWAVVILALIGALLVMGVLYARPTSDPVDVIGNVLKGLAPTIAGVLAFLKSQETHLIVNSRLDAFMAAHAKNAHAEGMAEGAAKERARSEMQPLPAPPPERAPPSQAIPVALAVVSMPTGEHVHPPPSN